MKLFGEQHFDSLLAASNYANCLNELKRYGEAKVMLLKIMPVARRVLGECHVITLRIRADYATALCDDDGATLNDLREAVTTFEESERIARRVLGGSHPLTVDIEGNLQVARDVLRAREGLNSISEAMAAMPPPGSSA